RNPVRDRLLILVAFRHAWARRLDSLPQRQPDQLTRARVAHNLDAKLAAGVGLSLVGGASASTMFTAGMPQSDNTSPNQRFVLSEEEMTDVSLAAIAASLAARVGQAGDVGGHG